MKAWLAAWTVPGPEETVDPQPDLRYKPAFSAFQARDHRIIKWIPASRTFRPGG